MNDHVSDFYRQHRNYDFKAQEKKELDFMLEFMLDVVC